MIWTQKVITKWATDTFGVPKTLNGIIQKTVDEATEFFRAYDAGDNHKAACEEAADVCIMLMQFCEHAGFDLLEEVDRKMLINSARTWNVQANGTGQHI